MALLTTMLTAGSGGANQDLNTTSSPTFNNLTLTGNQTVSGSQVIKTNLTVEGTTTLSGAATLKTTLNVEGATTLSGNAVAKGNLLVEGNITISGAATFKGGLTFEGALVAKTTLTVEGTTTLSGAATMKGTVTAEGALVAKTTLNVEGATTLSGNAVAKGTLLVEGATTLSGAATMKGTVTAEGALVAKTTLNVEGATTLSGAATVKGIATFEAAVVMKSTLNVEGETTLSGTLTIKTVGFTPTPTADTHIANKAYVDSQAGAGGMNLIIGGNFDTNPWQRGTSFTSPASGAFVADRLSLNIVGAGVINILKTADAPTVAEAGIFTSNCFHWDVTTADAAMAATDNYNIRYAMEGYDFAQIAQRAFTLSFWVKSTKTGIFSVGFSNSGGNRSYVAEYTVNTTDTWEKKTVTVSASPATGTWDYTNGIGILLFFNVASGSNFTTSSLNTWNSDGLISSSNQVNGMDSTSNNFKLALVKVESGSTATAFPLRTFEEELALCQRYYEKSYDNGTNPATNTSNGVQWISFPTASTGTMLITSNFKVKKCKVPTITSYDIAGTSGTVYKGAAGKTAFVTNQGMCAFTNGTTDATSATDLGYHFVADAEL